MHTVIENLLGLEIFPLDQQSAKEYILYNRNVRKLPKLYLLVLAFNLLVSYVSARG